MSTFEYESGARKRKEKKKINETISKQAYYKTTDHRPPTHRPTDHRQPTTNPPTSAPPTHRPPRTDHQPTVKCSTDPPTQWPLTHRQVLHDPLITDSPTYRPYYNWLTTLWLANLILTKSPSDQFFQIIIRNGYHLLLNW